jgi:hypothetical protein
MNKHNTRTMDLQIHRRKTVTQHRATKSTDIKEWFIAKGIQLTVYSRVLLDKLIVT